jgi:hypothetical protein
MIVELGVDETEKGWRCRAGSGAPSHRAKARVAVRQGRDTFPDP